MKKILLSAIVLSSILSASSVEVEKIQNLPIIKQSQIKITEVQELDNIYHVRGVMDGMPGQSEPQTTEFFMTKNFKQLIQGRGYHTESRNPVTFPVDTAILEGNEAITYGTGKEVIYIFTDPECPYCKQLEKELPRFKDKYTFKIFLFPLPRHRQAIPMSKYILAGSSDKVKFERLLDIANGSTEYQNFTMSQKQSSEYQKVIDGQLDIAKAARINATPTTLNADGELFIWTEPR